jgi:hypothetical protein
MVKLPADATTYGSTKICNRAGTFGDALCHLLQPEFAK